MVPNRLYKLPMVADGADVCGMHEHLDMHALVAKLIPDGMPIMSVTMQRLKYTEVRGDTFDVSGVAEENCYAEIDCEGVKNEAGKIDDALGHAEPSAVESDEDEKLLPQSRLPRHERRRMLSSPDVAIVEHVADALGLVPAEVLAAVDGGDSDEGAASSEGGSDVLADGDECDVAPKEPDVATPANIVEFLSADTTDAVTDLLPDFVMNHRWEVVRRSDAVVVSKTRCIQGRCLRADCRVHGTKCKMHEDYRGERFVLEAELMKWAIACVGMDIDQHMDLVGS